MAGPRGIHELDALVVASQPPVEIRPAGTRRASTVGCVRRSAGHSSAWSIDLDEGLQAGHDWSIDVRFASEARQEKAEVEASIKGKKRDMEEIHESTAARIKVENAMQTFPKGGSLAAIASYAKVSSNVAKGVLHDLLLRKVVQEWQVQGARQTVVRRIHPAGNGREAQDRSRSGKSSRHPDKSG